VLSTVPASDIAIGHRFPLDWAPLEDLFACLEVRDTGSGIADKDIEKLFDPFFSSKFTGRGLGLSAVLGILRSLHGGATVESEPDKGSIFRIYFPLAQEQIFIRPDAALQDSLMDFSGTVLLIEDEMQVRNMAETMLTRLGFTVLVAKDGVEAVEVFRRHQGEIRVVLCDLTMPRMDGWETLAGLRALAPDIPVILTSGYDEVQVMQGDHSQRPQAFLQKPFKRQDLERALGAALKSSRR
jgi:CheY-like chemotaxis protein